MSQRSFASDNASGVHPEVLAALARANEGHALGYGRDEITARARDRVREVLGGDVEPFFVWGGTAANVVALATVCRPHEAVVCAAGSHLDRDECGATERFAGCKLLPAATREGKVTPDALAARLGVAGVVHHSQPRVLSVAQPTEVGTVYSLAELRELADAAHEGGLLVHIDGARLPNAAVALDVDLRATSFGAGADLLSFGGTKNGLMGAEAVVFRDRELAGPAAFVRKQAMHLASKMRFVAVQMEALLTGDLWRRVATHANAMAAALADALGGEVPLAYPRQTNAVFTRLPEAAVDRLTRDLDPGPLVWEHTPDPVVRWMCSFDTTPEDVENLASTLRESVAG